jgi:GH43 family beta-xylosidase
VKLAFEPVENTTYAYDFWAPEIHNIDDRWYIIFTGDEDPDNPGPEVDMLCDFNCPAINHKMFVLESSTSDIWDSEYTMKAELDNFDQGLAIDGTYLQHETGLYHIYSCWYSKYESWPSLLCIDKSRTPTHFSAVLTRFSVESLDYLKHPHGKGNHLRA